MKTRIIAPYILRLYIWEILKANLGMTDDDYDIDGDTKGYIPIVPLGEEPELEKFDKPYMVWGFAESPVNGNRTVGNMMIVVYATDFLDLSEVANTIVKTFESDWTVDEVNAYSSTVPGFIGIRFGHVEATTITGAEPEGSSGGRMRITVNIRYEYFSNYDLDTQIAQWDTQAQQYKRL